jgi:SAM-dependent methyltransferase
MRAKGLAGYIKMNSWVKKDSSVLEAGCMYGYLLDELKDSCNVKGIEIGAESVDFCKKKGLDVTDISLEDFLQTSSEKFDTIILSHVFEHLTEPDKVLFQINNHLNPGGTVILSVPNSGSVTRKLFGRYWGWWQVPVHINHFNEQALRRMASINNFKVESIRYMGGDSLMLLLNFINLFGFRKKESQSGIFQKFVILFFTTFLRYWYFVGNEELTMVLKKNN